MERLLKYKTPILNFIGGASLGFCIGFSIHEYLLNQEEGNKILGGTKRKVISNGATQKSYTKTDVHVVKEENDHSKTKKGSKTNEKLEDTFKDRKVASKTENPRAISGIERDENQRDTSKTQIGNTDMIKWKNDIMEERLKKWEEMKKNGAVEVKFETNKDSKLNEKMDRFVEQMLCRTSARRTSDTSPEKIEEKGPSTSKILNEKDSKSIKKKGHSKKVASKIEKGFEKDSVQENQIYFLRSSVQEQKTVGKKNQK